MPKIQGEGDYVAGREFQDAQRRFAKEGPVKAKGREAADALSGPEASDLEDARRRSAEGRTQTGAHEHERRRERRLDERLDQTFPASDPAPISPGSD
jgi:hypothetical protein